jgi:hypothetical protein
MIDFTIKEDFPNCEVEFDHRFSTLDACYEYLAKTKWPKGFICEECGHNTYWLSSKYIYICRKCEHHYSLTAGTIMHGTRKPITYWFKAMWWFTTRKAGVNAVNLQELLGLGSYHTAWNWLQKLNAVSLTGRFILIKESTLFHPMTSWVLSVRAYGFGCLNEDSS